MKACFSARVGGGSPWIGLRTVTGKEGSTTWGY